MGTRTKSLYGTDFAEWSARTAEALRAGHLDEVDLEHVAEEIEDLGKGARKAVKSQLRRMMLHLMKQQLQPERDCASWQVSITEARQEIQEDLEDSPSLIPYLEENLDRIYRQAAQLALIEVGASLSVIPHFPRKCPLRLDQLLEGESRGLIVLDAPAKRPSRRWWSKA